MKLNFSVLLAWLWGILGDAVEGFAHGALIGTGVDTFSPAMGGTALPLLHAAVLGGGLGAFKQALLYLNTNRVPALLVSASPAAVAPASVPPAAPSN